MFLFRGKKSTKSDPSASSESAQQTMQRRAKDYIATLQRHYPEEFESLLSAVEQNDLSRAKLILRGLSDIVDEGYIDPILQQLQAQH